MCHDLDQRSFRQGQGYYQKKMSGPYLPCGETLEVVIPYKNCLLLEDDIDSRSFGHGQDPRQEKKQNYCLVLITLVETYWKLLFHTNVAYDFTQVHSGKVKGTDRKCKIHVRSISSLWRNIGNS